MEKQETASLAELIDERLRLDAEIDRLQAEKKAKNKPIIDALKAAGIKQAFGSNGKGYRLQEEIGCEYGQEAYDYAKRNGLSPIFTPPPNITRAKVLEAHKKNLLTLAQFSRIQKCAGPLETTQKLVTIEEKPATGASPAQGKKEGT